MNAYSKNPELYGMENITDKLDTFQLLFVKVDELGWWDLERIQTDAGLQFISFTSVRVVWITLVEPYHQEINGQTEVK